MTLRESNSSSSDPKSSAGEGGSGAPLDHLQELRDTSKADRVLAEAKLLLPALRAVARSKNYALAYHGSLSRDIDIIAVPWTEQACEPLELFEALRAEAERVSGHTAFVLNDEKAKPTDYLKRSPEPKAHGRLGWAIHIAGTATYLDLSIIPTGQAHADVKAAELQRKLDAAYDEIFTQSNRAKNAEEQLARLRVEGAPPPTENRNRTK